MFSKARPGHPNRLSKEHYNTRAGKSSSRLIRPPLLAGVKKQLATHKELRRPSDHWITPTMQNAEWLLKASR